MVEFTSRILSKMNYNYKKLVDNSPPEIKAEISKGSFYQAMLEKMIANKQEQIKANIVDFTHGKYDPPALDLDIKLLSPKIIIHESLMDKHLVDRQKITSLIIDLGKIEAQTQLIHKEKNIDYNSCTTKKKMYDIVRVKFGQLKLTIDYNL